MFFLKKDISEETLIKIGLIKKENKNPRIFGVKYENNCRNFYLPEDDSYWIMDLDCPMTIIIYSGILLKAITDGKNIYDIGDIENKNQLCEFDYIEKIKQATKIFEYCIEVEDDREFDAYCAVSDDEKATIFSPIR